MSKEIFVVGAGAWGVALAHAAATGGCKATLCGRDQGVADKINNSNINPHYPNFVQVDDYVEAQLGYDGIDDVKTILMVVPAQVTRQAILDIGVDRLSGKKIWCCAQKGWSKAHLNVKAKS